MDLTTPHLLGFSDTKPMDPAFGAKIKRDMAATEAPRRGPTHLGEVWKNPAGLGENCFGIICRGKPCSIQHGLVDIYQTKHQEVTRNDTVKKHSSEFISWYIGTLSFSTRMNVCQSCEYHHYPVVSTHDRSWRWSELSWLYIWGWNPTFCEEIQNKSKQQGLSVWFWWSWESWELCGTPN